ncbi:MAG TPA: STAS/SEC14 domain-containing protein [Myxococcaceae bacterium]|nr:STAS/SEC14 domain-containing protein [Myxococcaceae bacterium]
MHTSSTISFDDSLWPLLVVKFTGVPTTPQWEAYLEELTRHLERGERFIALADMSGMSGTGPSEQRFQQVEWLKQHEARLRELHLGAAIVITSPVVRLAVSVVFFLKPAPMPYFIASNVTDAAEWVARRLEEKGLLTEAGRVREHFQLPPSAPPAGNTPGQS